MSTKATIEYEEGWHLYVELFDCENVYLRIDKADFLATPESLTVAIPFELWERLRKAEVEKYRPKRWEE